MMSGLTLAQVQAASKRISEYVHTTPVFTSETMDALSGRKLFFKAENLQKTGSFKARGAANAILLTKEERPEVSGVTTHSSGNYGTAVAYAAQRAGLRAVIVVPRGTSQAKCKSIQGYGAELVFCDPTPVSRKETCEKISREQGFPIVHPDDDYGVMAGQGTIALEFLHEEPDLDAILVPTAGGGMISGIAVAAKGLSSKCKVYAVEPEGKDLQKSLEKGTRLWEGPPKFLPTVADAIRLQQPGNLTFPILCQYAEKTVFSVSDAEIVDAMKLTWERMKLVIEAASGAAVAAALSQQMKAMPASLEKIGVVLCGGNVDLDDLPWMKSASIMSELTLAHIQAASKRIAQFVQVTPVFTSETMDALSGRKLFFKAENLQKTGSFKARGASNAILQLKEERPEVRGVITHSSGNHGTAVAYAAQRAGLKAVIVVPRGTSQAKCKSIQGYGAELVFCDPTPASRKETCERLSREQDFPIVHPYDDYRVMAGQGTIALELLEQEPDLDAILVPISGGGMTSGIAVGAKGLSDKCKVYAVEPEGKDLQRSLEEGTRLWEGPPIFLPTVADAIRLQQPGNLTFPILCQYAEKTVFTVSDAEIVDAMKFTWERMKLVIEAASGAAVAAALSQQMKAMPASLEKIGVVLCGGNVDLENLPWIKS
ncbi:unnamed protein product [Darwinula stevensoni]|uniref:Serine racemase n=1 Tax=Darwinula stevensoni TaxID=69355 RepID=A0A7R9A472_9CRUS|nr:unnamed protein product [Darwinula stevensoni]CAG0889398.1 unnamed protein product [Darwinula stevensoni]